LVESMAYVHKNCLGNKIGKVSAKYLKLIGNAIINQFPMSKFAMAS